MNAVSADSLVPRDISRYHCHWPVTILQRGVQYLPPLRSLLSLLSSLLQAFSECNSPCDAAVDLELQRFIETFQRAVCVSVLTNSRHNLASKLHRYETENLKA